MYKFMKKSPLETANNACGRLNISAQTLYAYVSRGLIRTACHPSDSRKRLYSSNDIDQLLHRQKRGRSRQAVAESTIDFGEPVLRSRISSIEYGQFYYRGMDAIELAHTASLEDVFELLCDTSIRSYNSTEKASYISTKPNSLARFVDALANQVTSDKSKGNKKRALQLLKLMADNAAGRHQASPDELIHEQLARAWSNDSRAPNLIRQALVLSADHELNASTFATRIAASAGANLSACLLAGVSTLSGSHHGGLTNLCLAWMRENEKRSVSGLRPLIDGVVPGFGHRLYPNGDPRAVEIIKKCPPSNAWARLARDITKATKCHPTLDFGLATLEHQLKLPKGAGFSIFAVGRTVGWLAHCFEQRKNGELIRPRAK